MSGKKAKSERRAERATFEEAAGGLVTWLRPMLMKIRQEFARRYKIRVPEWEAREDRPVAKLPRPCDTCAIRASADFSDGNTGFIFTTLGFIDACAREKGVFLCHEDKQFAANEYSPAALSDGTPLPCIGWMVLKSPMPEPANIEEIVGKVELTLALDAHRTWLETL